MTSVTILRDVIDKLSESDRVFAQSLIDQANNRGLTAKQAAFVAKLISRANQPRPKPINVMPLVDFMHDAKIKRPVLLLTIGDQDIRLSIAGPGSRTPGYIVVTSADREFQDRQFYGRIGLEGQFEPSLSLEPETHMAITDALKAMAKDPAGTAAAYGRMTGSCCFCRLPLTDEKSLHVGYGRICARKYGLPYGATT